MKGRDRLPRAATRRELLGRLPQGATRRELLIVLGLGLLLTGVVVLGDDLLTTGSVAFVPPLGDHHRYITMAQHGILNFHEAPFNWLVLNPLLAAALPFDLQANFFLITFVCLWLTGVTMYYIVRRFHPQPELAFTGMFMFFSLSWATRWLLHDFWLPDALGFLLMCLALYCILARIDLGFALFLALGVATKQAVFFIVPLYYTLRARRAVDERVLARLVLLVLPAVGVWLALRLAIPATNPFSYGGVFAVYAPRRLTALGSDTLGTVLLYTVNTFGALVMLLPFFALRRNARLALQFAPFLVLVYAQLLFVPDVQRMLIVGFPALILLALNGVAALVDHLGVRLRDLVVLPLVVLVLTLQAYYPVTDFNLRQAIIVILYLAAILQFRLLLRPIPGWTPIVLTWPQWLVRRRWSRHQAAGRRSR